MIILLHCADGYVHTTCIIDLLNMFNIFHVYIDSVLLWVHCVTTDWYIKSWNDQAWVWLLLWVCFLKVFYMYIVETIHFIHCLYSVLRTCLIIDRIIDLPIMYMHADVSLLNNVCVVWNDWFQDFCKTCACIQMYLITESKKKQ